MRMQKAAQVYRQRKAELLIATGGIAGQGVRPESKAMKELAISEGVPEENILLESNAQNTIENALFTRELLWEGGWKRVVVVTSNFHVERAKEIFGRVLPSLAIEYEVDIPPLSKLELEREGETEKRMLRLLSQHLQHYVGFGLDLEAK